MWSWARCHGFLELAPKQVSIAPRRVRRRRHARRFPLLAVDGEHVVAVDHAGQTVALDITVASPVTSSALAAGAAATAGAAARILEMVKRRKYSQIDVHPVAIETHGRLGQATRDLIKKLGRQLPARERPAHVARLLQDLACALQRASADLILKAVR